MDICFLGREIRTVFCAFFMHGWAKNEPRSPSDDRLIETTLLSNYPRHDAEGFLRLISKPGWDSLGPCRGDDGLDRAGAEVSFSPDARGGSRGEGCAED